MAIVLVGDWLPFRNGCGNRPRVVQCHPEERSDEGSAFQNVDKSRFLAALGMTAICFFANDYSGSHKAARSSQVGFDAAMRATFFARLQDLICFSRSMALITLPVVSK